MQRENISDDIYSLAMGPTSEVCSYSGCIVNRVQFHTAHRDNRRTTQNSGVYVLGESEGDQFNFYGVLDEVLDFNMQKEDVSSCLSAVGLTPTLERKDHS